MNVRMIVGVIAVVGPVGGSLAYLLGNQAEHEGSQAASAADPAEREIIDAFGPDAAERPLRAEAPPPKATVAGTEARRPKSIDPGDRQALLAALARSKDERALQQHLCDLVGRDDLPPEPLLALWKRARSPQLKETLLWALGQVEGDAPLDALETAARKEPLPSLRAKAVEALLAHGSERGRAAARQAATNDAAPDVRGRAAALLALHASSDPQTATTLGELAKADDRAEVRVAAAEGLAAAPSQHGLALLEGLAEGGRTKAERALAARLSVEVRQKLSGEDLTEAFTERVHPLARESVSTESTNEEAGE